MVAWLIAVAGVFYLLFSTTMPKGGGGKGVSTDEGSGAAGAAGNAGPGVGTHQETVAEFTGGAYDPAKNPFRAAPAQQAQAEDPGLLPDEMPVEEEVPADEAIPEEEDGGGMDVGFDEGGDGQYN